MPTQESKMEFEKPVTVDNSAPTAKRRAPESVILNAQKVIYEKLSSYNNYRKMIISNANLIYEQLNHHSSQFEELAEFANWLNEECEDSTTDYWAEMNLSPDECGKIRNAIECVNILFSKLPQTDCT